MKRATLVLGLLLGATGVAAQTGGGSEMVERGVRAYQEVELSTAAIWLRRAFSGSLAPAERIRALSYLGATEVIRGAGRRDSAAAAFRRLLLLDPRQRLDPLVFPPVVMRLFDDVRRATTAVLVVPEDGVAGRLATVYGTSAHELEARLAREDGVVVRTLYVGPIGDSLDLRWDGRDTAAAYLPSGRYRLSVASRPSLTRPIVRLVIVPIEVEVVVPEPLPLPPPLPDAAFLPERTTRGPGFRSLTLGLAAGGLVLAMPALIADGSKTSETRFAVAGAVSFAGIVGFFTQHGRPLATNAALNVARRADWAQRRAAVTAENERRRQTARVTVRAGEPTIIDRAEGLEVRAP